MKLSDVKLSFLRDNNSQGLAVIQKIQKYASQNNVSYNQAITYLLSNYSSSYEKRILGICRSIYPYTGEIKISNFIEEKEEETESNENKINEEQDLQKVNVVVNYSDYKERDLHAEDKDIKQKKIGVGKELQTNFVQNNSLDQNVPVQALDTSKLKKKKAPRKKKKDVSY